MRRGSSGSRREVDEIDLPYGPAEESFRDLLEASGYIGAQGAMSGDTRRAAKVANIKQMGDRLRRGLGAVGDAEVGSDHFRDGGREQRIVGAAEEHRVGARAAQIAEI